MDVWGFDPDAVSAMRRSPEEQQLDFTYHNEAEDEAVTQIPLAGADQIRELWRIFEFEGQHDEL